MSRIEVNTKGISDGQVTTSDLANGAVTASKIANPLASLTVNSLTAGGLAFPTSDGANGHVLTTNGSGTLSFGEGGGSGASVTSSDSAPSSPSAGDLWFDTEDLILYVYYNDGSSSQWVKSNPSSVPVPSTLNVAKRGSSVSISLFNGSLPIVARSGTISVGVS
jgi:hypothetical protein